MIDLNYYSDCLNASGIFNCVDYSDTFRLFELTGTKFFVTFKFEENKIFQQWGEVDKDECRIPVYDFNYIFESLHGEMQEKIFELALHLSRSEG